MVTNESTVTIEPHIKSESKYVSIKKAATELLRLEAYLSLLNDDEATKERLVFTADAEDGKHKEAIIPREIISKIKPMLVYELSKYIDERGEELKHMLRFLD